MFGDLLQSLTAGKQVEYENEQWILLHNTLLRTNDGESLFLAVKAGDSMPAQTYLIPAPSDIHLQIKSA